ncbi:hypothetical protein NL676_025519 [Syzygium grande]|nr:hypothetical protein NL676_025519 [Syzygium grande]
MEFGTNRGSTTRRLKGRNAAKHYDYDPSSLSHSPDDSSTSASASLHMRSLDLFKQMSFRVEEGEIEIDRICRNLGLSRINDLAIPTAAWEARKTSNLPPQSRLNWRRREEGYGTRASTWAVTASAVRARMKATTAMFATFTATAYRSS